MDSAIFEQCVQKSDIKFHWQDKKVALTIENYPTHPRIKNLKVGVFTTKCYIKTQPMDHRVKRA